MVEFRNAYGELPGTQIPKLPFYGGITILYFFVAVFWGFLYYQHSSDICETPPWHRVTGSREADIVCSGGSELHNGHSDLPSC